MAEAPHHDLRRAVLMVACLNLAYFAIEFAVALAIGSVSLFADSVNFLEDTSLNLLILVGLGWTARRRAKLGMVLAGILLVPGLATLWTAWAKLADPLPPEPFARRSTAPAPSPSTSAARSSSPASAPTPAASPAPPSSPPATTLMRTSRSLPPAWSLPSPSPAWPDLIVGLGIFGDERRRRARRSAGSAQGTPGGRAAAHGVATSACTARSEGAGRGRPGELSLRRARRARPSGGAAVMGGEGRGVGDG